jgi:glycosyltransferase involved in cell wall biosynthesis
VAASLGVEARVRWLGPVRDVAPVYELGDAFVLPSSYETFSLVTFEAAAAGLPIVAAPVSGVRELIEDGRNGFLVAPQASEIAARLRELSASPELRAAMGAAARATVERFSWRAMVAGYDALLESLAGEG